LMQDSQGLADAGVTKPVMECCNQTPSIVEGWDGEPDTIAGPQ
jgi:hypothetical protein